MKGILLAASAVGLVILVMSLTKGADDEEVSKPDMRKAAEGCGCGR